MNLILDESDVSILKELLYRIDPVLFREFVAYELHNKNKTSDSIRYELLRKLEDAGKRFIDKKTKIKQLVDSI